MSKKEAYANYVGWKNWNELFSYRPYQARLYRAEFAGHMLKGKKVLDVGFGSGAFLAWARDQDAQVAGIELQDELVDAAISAGIQVFRDLGEIGDTEFDVVTFFDVLEHIPREAIPSLLASANRILRDQGLLVVRVPNCQSVAGLLTQFGDATHLTMLSGPVLAQMMHLENYEVISVRAAREFTNHWLKAVIKPIQLVIRAVSNTMTRITWSNRSAILSPSVLVIAKKKSFK